MTFDKSPMNHYVIKKDGTNGARVHLRDETLQGAVTQVIQFDRAATPPTFWWVLSSPTKYSTGDVVKDITL